MACFLTILSVLSLKLSVCFFFQLNGAITSAKEEKVNMLTEKINELVNQVIIIIDIVLLGRFFMKIW